MLEDLSLVLEPFKWIHFIPMNRESEEHGSTFLWVKDETELSQGAKSDRRYSVCLFIKLMVYKFSIESKLPRKGVSDKNGSAYFTPTLSPQLR